MKSQASIADAATLEDIVFTGRNKQYGAYALNKNHRKVLLASFLVALTGFSTAVAVPFLQARNNGSSGFTVNKGVIVTLVDPPENEVIAPPPPPPPLPVQEQVMRYLPPLVVEEPTDVEAGLISVQELLSVAVNNPVLPPDLEPVPAGNVITEPDINEPILFPEEQATFRNGDLSEFRYWVQENIKYPDLAVANQVFGKVILEFCVNARGEVTDIRVLRPIDPLLDNESMRVIASSPLWKAARQGGRPVKQRFVIPVVFTLQN
jgi:protein TonB